MCLVGPDEVDDDVHPRSVRRLAHGTGDVRPVAQHLLSAKLPRKPAPPLVGVDRDHGSGAQHAQQLERDVADSADADHRDGRAGSKPRHELLDRMVGGDAGVGVRRHLRRGSAGRQRQQRSLVDQHVVRKATVPRQACELVPFAVHVEAATARHAEAAAVGRVDEHGIAYLRRGDAIAHGVHPAGVLVAEHQRQPDADRVHQSLDRVEIGRADAGAADAHDDVARTARLGVRALDELEPSVVIGEERGPHASR